VVSALVLLLVMGLASVSAMQRSRETASMVEHTYNVLAQLDAIGSQVDQYVTITRVFVLTGTEDFLGPLEDLRPQIANEMAALELLVADDPEQLARLAQLRPPVERRLDTSDDYITIRRRSALAEAVEEIPKGGESLATEIRERISEMATVETQLLGQRRAEAADSDTAALVTVSFAGLSGLGVLALTFAALRRQTIERIRAEKSLRTSEERLRFVIRGTNDGVWD
jgi:CHASE3 domain sensor protein